MKTSSEEQQKYALKAHNIMIENIKESKDDEFVKANQHLLTKPFNPELNFSAKVVLLGAYDWEIIITILHAQGNRDFIIEQRGSGFVFGTGETTVYGIFNIPMEILLTMPCEFDFGIVVGVDGGAVLTLVVGNTVAATLVGPAAGLGVGAVHGIGHWRIA